MTVEVNIPARVRVDVDALCERCGELEETVRRAASRALAASRDEVPGGGSVRLAAPDFSWAGPAATTIPDEVRAEVERRLFGALIGALDDVQTAAPAARPTLGRGDAAEPLDPARHAPLLRRYVVPSYAEGEDAVGLPVEDEGFVAASPAITFAVPGPDALLGVTLLQAIEQGRVTVVTERLIGVMFALAGGGYGIAVFRCWRSASGGIRFQPHGEPFSVNLVSPVLRKKRGAFSVEEEPFALVPSEDLEFELVSADPGAPAFRDALRDYAREWVESAVADERTRLLAGVDLQHLDQLVAGLVDDAAAQMAHGTRLLARLHHGGGDVLIRFAVLITGLPATIPLIPLTQEADTGPVGQLPTVGPSEKLRVQAAADPEADQPTVQPEQLPPLLETRGEPEFENIQFPQGERQRELVCESFEGEPALSELGEDGHRLRLLMASLARRLDLPPCEYAGGFALLAAQTISERAAAIGAFAITAQEAFLRPRPGGTGNLGHGEFEPAPSPAVQYLRHVAAAAPELRALAEATTGTYRKPEHAGRIADNRSPASWQLAFVVELGDRMRWAVAVLFGMTCRILLLQLLRSSRDAITGRQQHIGAYAQLFVEAILPRLRRITELIELRERLLSAIAYDASQVVVHVFQAGVPASIQPQRAPEKGGLTEAAAAQLEWERAREDVLHALGPGVPPPVPAPDARAGQVLLGRDGRPEAIRDQSGRPWTLAALDRGIVTRRGLIEDFDPIVMQLTRLPDAVERFRHGSLVLRVALMLQELAEANENQRAKVADSWIYAVRASGIKKSLRAESVPRSGYALTGIHLQAHIAIGDAFADDEFYSLGIRALFGAELGRQGIADFLEFTGTLLLAVVCPPLAFAAGIVTATTQSRHAAEREELYGALLNPELVLSRADVEVELFMARLGIALAIVPEVGTILRLGTAAGRVTARYGVRGLARAAPSVVQVLERRFTHAMAESLRRGLLIGFARELATDRVMNRLAELVLAPVVESIVREVETTGPVGGSTGAVAMLERLRAEAEAREGR